jgi:hypothetical protein
MIPVSVGIGGHRWAASPCAPRSHAIRLEDSSEQLVSGTTADTRDTILTGVAWQTSDTLHVSLQQEHVHTARV